MRNCFFLKFIAIFLCAASLLGIVGGTAGALLLAENDLYNKTVDEVIAQRVQNLATEAATQIASRYADQTLGGCPEEISRYSRTNLLSWNFTSSGYAITDGDGNVLLSLNPELKDQTQTHIVPVIGQYMHLVSLQSESQALEASVQKQLESYHNIMADMDGNTVPAEGIALDQVIFTAQDGHVLYEATCNGLTGSSTYFYWNYLLDNGVIDNFSNTYQDHQSSKTGFLFYNADQQLAYTSFLWEEEKPFQETVYGIYFSGADGSFTFKAENPEGIGTISNENGYLLFTTFAAKQEALAEETVPATTEETLPAETIAAETPGTALSEETIPEETTEETLPEETIPETEEISQEESENTDESYQEHSSEEEDEPSSASAVPENSEEYEENYQDDTQETESDTSDQDAYFDEIAKQADERIYLEWLLANGLITEKDIPQDLISDEALYDWLVYFEFIDPDQTFPVVSEPQQEEITSDEVVPEETVPEISEPILINGKPLENYQVNLTDYHNANTGEYTTAKYVYLPMPELTVEIYAGPEMLKDASSYDALRILRQLRGYLLPVIGVSFVLFILSAVYLCTAAGRKPKTEVIRAGGINRLPLDLYVSLGAFASIGAIALAGAGVPVLLDRDFTLACSLAAASGFVSCLILTGFCFAFVAQIKTGSGMWWRNTLTVRFVFLFMRCAEKLRSWLAEKGLPKLFRFSAKVWHLVWKLLVRVYHAVEKFTARTGARLNRYFSLMPLTWQWVVSGMLLFCLMLIACNTYSELLTFVCLAASLALLLYVSHCFGVLLESTRKMRKGNLDAKVEDKFMLGCFRDFAKDLNGLADVTTEAAQKQLKSERMKTELITNVSHDIKTPLTSIINYVDLLQKPHSDEQGDQYLEVLDRQSQRLKKLVDDLMDMSKASTGNMAVEITRVDMVESVNQALGEFSDKLERAQLYPIFRHSDASVPIMADGKLVWRVLSNILSNAVKYAMPKTRIYLDLTHIHGQVILSLKNISREELNVTAEELMERFVRGDISRNTEGSGLGLNIAKSLMELQKGQLQILVDGDLFKVTLIFPDAR